MREASTAFKALFVMLPISIGFQNYTEAIIIMKTIVLLLQSKDNCTNLSPTARQDAELLSSFSWLGARGCCWSWIADVSCRQQSWLIKIRTDPASVSDYDYNNKFLKNVLIAGDAVEPSGIRNQESGSCWTAVSVESRKGNWTGKDSFQSLLGLLAIEF